MSETAAQPTTYPFLDTLRAREAELERELALLEAERRVVAGKLDEVRELALLLTASRKPKALRRAKSTPRAGGKNPFAMEVLDYRRAGPDDQEPQDGVPVLSFHSRRPHDERDGLDDGLGPEAA